VAYERVKPTYKLPVNFSLLLTKVNFFLHVFTKIRPVRDESLRAEGRRTDGHDESNSRFLKLLRRA